jgi:IS30 family transposase
MKCVCPMGGDRTCPDDCPLAVWSGLSKADRKAQRKPVAEKLYKQGFTMEHIATQLGVSHPTIVRDLREFVHDEQTLRPKGGRPKGSGKPRSERAPKAVEREERIAALRDAGLSTAQIAAEVGLGQRAVSQALEHVDIRREALADPKVERTDLSLTAQQKLDTALRRHQRELDLIFEGRVQEEINQRLDHIILPVWRKKIADAKKIYDARRAITSKETFNLIIKCLHTDTRRHVSDDIVNDAFTKFMALEKYLLNEKDSPTKFTGLPTTAAEWEQRKQEAATLRRTKRGHANVSRSQ